MAGKLHFSLVSPERELFSGEVDQVDAPGTEGDFGVLAGHAPFMTTLKEGQIRVYNAGQVTAFEVRGGFADVTPDGLTVLAEHAVGPEAVRAAVLGIGFEDVVAEHQRGRRTRAAGARDQQAAARISVRHGPVDTANCVSVGRQPAAFASVSRNGAAVETRRFSRIPLANSSLLPVVTF